MKLEIEMKHSHARAKILLVLLSVFNMQAVSTDCTVITPRSSHTLCCVEILAHNRSPVASRSPPATVLLQRSHTCIYYCKMGVNGMLSTVIRSHAANVTEPCRTVRYVTVRLHRHGTAWCGSALVHTPILSVSYCTVPCSARFHTAVFFAKPESAQYEIIRGQRHLSTRTYSVSAVNA